MQNLDVISINLWQILISLCNLLLLFLILKRFLYKPVKRVMAERQAALKKQYAAADEAQQEAERNKQAWTQKMQNAQAEADKLLKKAATTADFLSEQMIAEAREKADGIVHQAEAQARLEQKKAEAGIKKEIVDVSAVLTEKMLGREISTADHRAIIDSFINEMEENNDGNE